MDSILSRVMISRKSGVRVSHSDVSINERKTDKYNTEVITLWPNFESIERKKINKGKITNIKIY